MVIVWEYADIRKKRKLRGMLGIGSVLTDKRGELQLRIEQSFFSE